MCISIRNILCNIICTEVFQQVLFLKKKSHNPINSRVIIRVLSHKYRIKETDYIFTLYDFRVEIAKPISTLSSLNFLNCKRSQLTFQYIKTIL